MKNNKRYEIGRIVSNAQILENPEAFECFEYGDLTEEQNSSFNEVLAEISELHGKLPKGIGVADLPDVYCGNKKTKVFGKASCNATQGHMILETDSVDREMFPDKETAMTQGYRPCGKCMQKEYAVWKADKE